MTTAMKPLPADGAGSLRPPFDSYSYVPRSTYVYFEGAEEHPFKFGATQFEIVNAWWLSDAAMLAYSNESIATHWCKEAGFTETAWLQSRHVQCFVAIRDEYVFVAFCEIPPSGLLSDRRLDFEAELVRVGTRGFVSRRVHDALDEIWESTPTSLYPAGLGQKLNTIAREHPNATFWFTGHGFGGALAALAALRHPQVAGLYTFGAPRLGDRQFQRSIDLPAWRFVNHDDVVTRLPVVGRYRPLKLSILGRHHGVGELRFIESSGRIRPAEVLSGNSRLDPIRYLRAKFSRSGRMLAGHAPLQYSIGIWNAYVGGEMSDSLPREPALWNWLRRAFRWSAMTGAVLLMILVAGVGVSLALRMLPEEAPEKSAFHRPTVLETGLGADRQEFYSLAEGSEVFPRAFADAARQAEPARGLLDRLRRITKPEKPFLENLERYGFIPIPKTVDNPYGYIGLTVRKRIGTGLEMIGVNCAACHVGQIEHKGRAFRIDGGPNMLDIFSFFGDLADSASRLDIDVLLKELRVSVSSMTREGVQEYIDQLENMKKLNQPENTPPLHGRADAFGTARAMFFADFRPLTAPASFPHIWGFEQTAWYHWNANTNSVLERNIGQALGLGAGIDLANCSTTIELSALDRMERLGYKIGPPIWPEELGPIDRAAAARGRAIYMGEGTYNTPLRGDCAGCHESYKIIQDGSAMLKDYTLLPLNVVGTDPNEAWNSMPRVLLHSDVCDGNRGPMERKGFGQAHMILLNNVRMEMRVKALSDHSLFNGGRSAPVWRATVLCEDESQKEYKGRTVGDCPVYPAKPHLGVWATAPYLHNGSVPTLWDMLKPPEERPQKFNVGHREYDPVNVGYVQTSPPDPKYPVFDTTVDGNHKTGHPFGTALADNEKRDLIEFLKSITPEIEQQMHEQVLRRPKQ